MLPFEIPYTEPTSGSAVYHRVPDNTEAHYDTNPRAIVKAQTSVITLGVVATLARGESRCKIANTRYASPCVGVGSTVNSNSPDIHNLAYPEPQEPALAIFNPYATLHFSPSTPNRVLYRVNLSCLVNGEGLDHKDKRIISPQQSRL